MSRHLISIVVLTLFSILAWANGGPIDGSAVYTVGNIRPIRVASVTLMSEDLALKMEGDFTRIRASYRLQHKSSSSQRTITYGFPVDIIYNEFTEDLDWRDTYVPEMQFLLNGQKLEIKKEVREKTGTKVVDGYGEGYEKRTVWFVTDFEIPAGETAELEIQYLVKNGFTDWETSKSAIPFFDVRRLYYDFSAAQYWGDGTLPVLNVSVEATENVLAVIEGLDMQQEGNIYTYHGENVSLEDLPVLLITYDMEPARLSAYFQQRRLSAEKIKSITASSTLPGNYQVENLLDNDLSTAWVEGKDGSGVGTKITVELVEPSPVIVVGLVNGYTKNETTYTRNNRIKKIRVEIFEEKGENSLTLTEAFEEVLPEHDFVPIDASNFGRLIDVPCDAGDGFFGGSTKKVVLTILEVYPGTRYNDTCISEIFLLSY